MSPSIPSITAFSLGILLFAGPAAQASDWHQWRGPERNGIVSGNHWPAHLKDLEKAWTVENLGPSYSGPIVTADRVFTTETRDEKDEVVSAYDRNTGELLWSKSWKGAMKVPFFAAKNGSWIRSTPAYDGETLYVGGMEEVLVALDGRTGETRWKLDFPGKTGHAKPPFGFVCSPLIDGDDLYVEAAGSLFKIRRTTGEIVWRSEGFSGGEMTSEGSFSSPILAELAGVRQLVVQSRQELVGVDPENGEVLWRQGVPSFRGMNILTPTLWGDGIFTSTYRNASYFFRVERGETGFQVEEVWQNKVKGYMSSPVVIEDTAYLHLGNGRLTAIDLRDGKGLWTTTPFGPYWSMAAQDDKILALDAEGELILFRADREGFELLDRRQVSSRQTWAHLATAGDEIFIRDLHGLTAWRWRNAESADPPAAEAP